ncbi:hypothetical protein [Vannielia litorea]|uniref:hypothetical protein n=1 Tax=Vannielia litorea TaxID=1217970 RepID=UPI001C95A396|nr:hypothetical protein [Vannielia litorea]MBY6047143.1 hypothetical protein [Vannielia litorea]MBY6074557.1 hypothetical protein [Vannielia litorea]
MMAPLLLMRLLEKGPGEGKAQFDRGRFKAKAGDSAAKIDLGEGSHSPSRTREKMASFRLLSGRKQFFYWNFGFVNHLGQTPMQLERNWGV